VHSKHLNQVNAPQGDLPAVFKHYKFGSLQLFRVSSWPAPSFGPVHVSIQQTEIDWRVPSSWYLRMKMQASDMVCSWERRCRAQSETGSRWRSVSISLLMRLRRCRDAPFVDLSHRQTDINRRLTDDHSRR